jgi:heme exporter protein D
MNWLEFFAMKGYAWYVWGSYGVALLFLLLEIVLVRHKRKIALRQLRLIRDAETQESL